MFEYKQYLGLYWHDIRISFQQQSCSGIISSHDFANQIMRLQLKLNQNSEISFVPQIFFKEWESFCIKKQKPKNDEAKKPKLEKTQWRNYTFYVILTSVYFLSYFYVRIKRVRVDCSLQKYSVIIILFTFNSGNYKWNRNINRLKQKYC